jgi:CheY-like chemotaxis protein
MPHSLKILVVEDYPDAADCLAALLRIYGYEVEVAYNGQEALAMARRNPPQVAILDIGLPRLDGYCLAKELCQQLAHRPLLIAVTGYGSERDREMSPSAGFDHHFLKPVEPRLLADILCEYGERLAYPARREKTEHQRTPHTP